VGSGASETCAVSGTPDSSAPDSSTPLAGQVFWYLSRARHGCGAGTYGYGGEPPSERITAACQ